MGILESVAIVIGGLLCLAFVIRVVVEVWKIIFALAPFVIGIAAILFFLLNVGYTGSEQEVEVEDANHIESIENSSGRSEHGR